MKNNLLAKDKVKTKFVEQKNMRMLIFTLILMSEVFALINHNFLSTYNLVSIGQSVAPYAALSLGAIFPIALGCTDLSTGAVCIASAVVAGKFYAMGMPLVATIPVMIAFGALAGFMNGMLISKLKLPSFIVTLGTMMFIRGVSAIFANQPDVLFPTNTWYNKVFSNVNGIPVGFAWIIIMGLSVGWFFRKSKTGRHILAVGSNEKASVIAGLDTAKLKVVAFTVSGLMAGIAAVLWSASFATITVATGNGMELDAIAGAYIGGSAAAGGSVHAAGAVIGAILLVIIRNGLNFVLAVLNVELNSTYVTYAITGLIVVLAVFLDKTKGGRSKAANKKGKFDALRNYIIPVIAFLLALAMIASNVMLFVNQREKDSKTVAVIMKSENSAFWISVRAGAEDAAEENGYKLLIRGAKSEDSSELPTQRELMSVMMSENPAGLGMATIANGFTDLLEEAYERNIPVFQFDSGLYAEDVETITKSEKNPLCGFIQGDSFLNAQKLAEAVYERLYNKIALSDDFTFGIIQHDNTVNAAQRTNGFKERIIELAEADPKTAGKCRVVVEVKHTEANNAYKDGLEALYEKGADAVYMTAEKVINQCYDAIAASGNKYDGMYFMGFDSGEKVRQWLYSDIKSEFICGISQDPYTLGRLTVETLIKNAQGEKVDELTIVPGAVYNKENYMALLKKKVVN